MDIVNARAVQQNLCFHYLKINIYGYFVFHVLNVSLVGNSRITVRIDCQSSANIYGIYFENKFVSFEQLSCKSYPPDGAIYESAGEHAVFVVKIAVNTIGFMSGRVLRSENSFYLTFRSENKYKIALKWCEN